MDAVFNVARKGYYYGFWKGKINNWGKWSDIIKKKISIGISTQKIWL